MHSQLAEVEKKLVTTTIRIGIPVKRQHKVPTILQKFHITGIDKLLKQGSSLSPTENNPYILGSLNPIRGTKAFKEIAILSGYEKLECTTSTRK